MSLVEQGAQSGCDCSFNLDLFVSLFFTLEKVDHLITLLKSVDYEAVHRPGALEVVVSNVTHKNEIRSPEPRDNYGVQKLCLNACTRTQDVWREGSVTVRSRQSIDPIWHLIRVPDNA
jgi:hypothetical protein